MADWNIQPPVGSVSPIKPEEWVSWPPARAGHFWLSLLSPQTHQEQRLPGSHEGSSEKRGLLSRWGGVLRVYEPRGQLGEKEVKGACGSPVGQLPLEEKAVTLNRPKCSTFHDIFCRAGCLSAVCTHAKSLQLCPAL